MIVTSFLLASLAALQVAPSGGPGPSTVMIDGDIRKPRSTDVAYAFECGGSSIALAWRQQWLPLAEAPLAEAQSVRLEKLAIRARPLAPSDRRQVQTLFSSFAWIEKAEVNCPKDRIEISLHGMLHRPWIDHLEERVDSRPRPITRTIQVAPDGSVKID